MLDSNGIRLFPVMGNGREMHPNPVVCFPARYYSGKLTEGNTQEVHLSSRKRFKDNRA